MKFVYPATFYPCDRGYGFTVEFPDLPGCITEGDTLENSMEMAIDAASGWLLDEIQNGKSLPKASTVNSIVPDEPDGFVSLVPVDLEEYGKQHGQKSVKKTLTVPAWLNTAAEQANINFSSVLQKALTNELHIQP